MLSSAPTPSRIDPDGAFSGRALCVGPDQCRSRAFLRLAIALYLVHSWPWMVLRQRTAPDSKLANRAGPARASTGNEVRMACGVMSDNEPGKYWCRSARHGQPVASDECRLANVANPKLANSHFITISGLVTRDTAAVTTAPTRAAGNRSATNVAVV